MSGFGGTPSSGSAPASPQPAYQNAYNQFYGGFGNAYAPQQPSQWQPQTMPWQPQGFGGQGTASGPMPGGPARQQPYQPVIGPSQASFGAQGVAGPPLQTPAPQGAAPPGATAQAQMPTGVQGQGSAVNLSNPVAQGPSDFVAGPSDFVAGPSDFVAGPSDFVAGPSFQMAPGTVANGAMPQQQQQAMAQPAAANPGLSALQQSFASQPFLPSQQFGFGGRIHRDDGGATPIVETTANQNPFNQQIRGQFAKMTPEQLQEAAVRLGGTPQGQTVQRVLQQKRMEPPSQQQPTLPSDSTAAVPVQPDLSGPPQSFSMGGVLEPKGGVHFPERGISPVSHAGFLNTAGPGRTDNLNIHPHADSYVLPADVVSGLGQGNSLAGAKAIEAAMHTGPFGTSMPSPGHFHGMSMPRPSSGGVPGFSPTGNKSGLGFATGGRMSAGGAGAQFMAQMGHNGGPSMNDHDGDEKPGTVPILAAGGEYVLSPEQCAALGHGDVKRGHEILDKLVLHVRNRTIKELKGLKGPVKS